MDGRELAALTEAQLADGRTIAAAVVRAAKEAKAQEVAE
jgi:hypothetical protein